MNSEFEGAPDPGTGRFAVWIAGALGVASIVAYGSFQAQQRLAARDAASAVAQTSPTRADDSPAALIRQAASAEATLDTARLAALDRTLETSQARSTRAQDIDDLRLARASALSVRALEASIRLHNGLADPGAAKTELAADLTKGRELTDALTRARVRPAVVGAIDARFDLAEGRDIAALHPVVLLPDYPDHELQTAAVGYPLIIAGPIGDDDLAALIGELERAELETGLRHVLLAVAKSRAGDQAGARAAADAALALTPGQPLATALRSPDALVVAAAAPPTENPDSALQDGANDTAGVVDAAVADAEPKMDVGTSVAEEPAAVEPVEPEPVEPEPAKPEPAQPKPATAEPKPKPEPKSDPKPKPKPDPKPKSKPRPQPKSASGFDELLAQGCKLAKSGDAAEGFRVLKKAHDLKPGGAKITLCMAQAQAKLGRTASALALLDRVLRSSSKNKAALALAGKLEDKRGNKKGAEKMYRRLLAVDPEHAAAKAYLGE